MVKHAPTSYPALDFAPLEEQSPANAVRREPRASDVLADSATAERKARGCFGKSEEVGRLDAVLVLTRRFIAYTLHIKQTCGEA